MASWPMRRRLPWISSPTSRGEPTIVGSKRSGVSATACGAEFDQHLGQASPLEKRRAQIANRFTRFANVRFNLMPDLHQPIPQRRGLRAKALGDRVELEQDADQALEQRIVDLPAQTNAFGQDERKLAADELEPKPPEPPDTQERRRGAPRRRTRSCGRRPARSRIPSSHVTRSTCRRR